MTAQEMMRHILSYLDLNAKQFAESISLDRAQTIYDILNGRTKKFSNTMAHNIHKKYDFISIDALRTGTGVLIKGQEPIDATVKSTDLDKLELLAQQVRDISKEIEYLRGQIEIKDKSIAQLIEFITTNSGNK